MAMVRKGRKLTCKGYMTVSVAIILTLSISLCLTLIEGCRRSTIMLVAECAIDTGLNNILAEYHRELLNQYGLFFIDTSYGTGTPDYGNTLEHLKEYVEANWGGQEPVMELISEDLIDLHWDEGEIIGLSVSSDEGGAVLRRQITEYMEEHLGVSYLTELLDRIDVVEKYELTGDWYAEMKTDAESELQNWLEVQEENDNKTTVEELSFFENLLKDLQAGTLNLLLGMDDLSEAEIEKENYLSNRNVLQGSGMNPSLEFSDDVWDYLLLQEYILEKTGHYGDEKENSLLKYQTEYILCGMESDIANISEIADRLFALRAAANTVHILGDQEKMDFLKTVSDAIAAAIGLPEAGMVFEILFAVIWAGLEALWDVNCLLEGGEIPLIKNSAQWHYDIDALGQNMQGIENGADGGLTYGDYLRIFLAFQDKQITTYRLMDIMEMDIRLTPGNEEFRLDGCIDSVTVCIDIESGYGYQFFVTRNYGY